MSVDSQEVIERVKARLLEEGREARNLVAYSLLLEKPTISPRPKPESSSIEIPKATPTRSSKQNKRQRSVSAGRDPQASLRARHWGFLFRNLEQAVDEIYQTCETDESTIECKEAILMLTHYANDFQGLIQWLQVKWNYENTLPPQRPTSLSWEIRTSSSPGKAMHNDRKVSLSEARRILNFDCQKECANILNKSKNNNTTNKILDTASSLSLNNVNSKHKKMDKVRTILNNGKDEMDRKQSSELNRIDEKCIEYELMSEKNCKNVCNEILSNKTVDKCNNDKIIEIPSKSIDVNTNIGQLIINDKLEKVNKPIDNTTLVSVPKIQITTNDDNINSQKINNPGHDISNSQTISKTKDLNIPEDFVESSSNTNLCTLSSAKTKTQAVRDENKQHADANITPVQHFNEGSITLPIKTLKQKPKNSQDSKKIEIEDCVQIKSPKLKKKAGNDQLDQLNKAESPKVKKKACNDQSEQSNKTESPKVKKKLSNDQVDQSKQSHEVESLKFKKQSTNDQADQPGQSNHIECSKVKKKCTNNQVDQLRHSQETESTKVKKNITNGQSHEIENTSSVTDKIEKDKKQCKVTSSTPNEIEVKLDTKSNVNDNKDDVTSEFESKSNEDNKLLSKSTTKPGPTVNMNKASQVRQAYNQNRTPQKKAKSSLLGTPRNFGFNRSLDYKTTIMRQQGSGGKVNVRRTGDNKQSSSPLTNRWSGTSRSLSVRSHTTLGSSGRSSKSYNNLNEVRANHGKTPVNNELCRSGSFGCESRTLSSSSMSSSTMSGNGLSWADKVRGGTSSSHQSSSSQLSLQEDGEGWEVVRKGRRSHGGSTASLNSQGSYSSHLHAGASHKNKDGVSSFMKRRFNAPSTAMSMPSLVTSDTIIKKEISPPPEQVTPITKNTQTPASEAVHSPKKEKLARKKAKSQSSLAIESSNGSNNTEKNTKHSKDKNRKRIQSESPNSKNKIFCSENKLDDVTEVVSKVTEGTEVASKLNNDNEEINETCLYNGNKTKEVEENNSDIEQNNIEISDESTNIIKRTVVKQYSAPAVLPTSADYGASISEVSETSDADDEEDSSISLQSTTQTEGPKENGCASELLQVDKDSSRSYDSDSGMDEEEMLDNAAALESAVQEEQRLVQQIEETEKTEIEVANVCEKDDGTCELEPSDTACNSTKYDKLLASLSWADQVDALESLEELRHPGRVLHIHEKLSSPSRKLSLPEKLRRHHEKLAKAQELRSKLLDAKTEKLKDLFRRIDEVHNDKERLLEEKRKLFDRKMDRAEEKRRQYLQDIVNKAHDEEMKAREIAFINGLEAQIKLHDIMQQHQSHESRLADMAEERTRRHGEKAAKEAKAQERRKALEAERQARMLELLEKRKRRCERIDRQQAERREELLEQAREKARDHKERLSAIQQAQQAKECELVKRIQQKQEDSARRHEENMELIRQRALESTILRYSRGCDDTPKLVRYENMKLCTLCNSLLASEVYLLSHLSSKKHQDALSKMHESDIVSSEESATYNLKYIIDAPPNIDDPQITRDKERQKALKKRCRKLRARMNARGKEYMSSYLTEEVKDCSNKGRINKSLQSVNKLVSNQGSGPWSSTDVASLDKAVLELHRILDKGNKCDQDIFCALDGFGRLNDILVTINTTTDKSFSIIPAKSLSHCGRVFLAACRGNEKNCRHLLYSNMTGILIDYLVKRLDQIVQEATTVGSNNSINAIATLPSDLAAGAIFEVVAEVIQIVVNQDIKLINNKMSNEKDKAAALWQRLKDTVSYCVSVGIADKVSWYLGHVQGSLDYDPPVTELILAAMTLISSLANALTLSPEQGDPCHLLGTMHVTDACGVISLLYGLLLHQGGRSAQQSPIKLSPATLAITTAATTLLCNLASLDLSMFQTVLGSEGISLELRHICSYLLWYCYHWPCETILHNVITLVGYFTVNNKENQMVVQSGETPSVLQQLINLPWPYFSEPRLTHVLFPTLLACCLDNQDNIHILAQDMSFQVLEDYLNNDTAEEPLMKFLQKSQVQC